MKYVCEIHRFADFVGNRMINWVTREHSDPYSVIKVYSFPQLWGGGQCGFPGMGTAAPVMAQTTVIISRCHTRAIVYHANKLAYQIENVNDLFFKDLKNFYLVGQVDYKGQYES